MPRVRELTEEQKLAYSERMKLAWVKRKAKQQGYQQSPIIGVNVKQAEAVPAKEAKEALKIEVVTSTVTGDPWRDLPWPEALKKLGELKAEYARALEIMGHRSETAPKIRTCWTYLHHKDQADLPGMATAYRGCSRFFRDQEAKFVDNDNFDPVTGLVDPVFCCGTTCIALYNVYRAKQAYKKRESAQKR